MPLVSFWVTDSNKLGFAGPQPCYHIVWVSAPRLYVFVHQVLVTDMKLKYLSKRNVWTLPLGWLNGFALDEAKEQWINFSSPSDFSKARVEILEISC